MIDVDNKSAIKLANNQVRLEEEQTHQNHVLFSQRIREENSNTWVLYYYWANNRYTQKTFAHGYSRSSRYIFEWTCGTETKAKDK